MELCTICLQKGHVAASCQSPMARFLSGSGPVTAARDTPSKKEKASTQSTSAGEGTFSFPLLAEYEDLVEKASDALGGKRSVSRWLGLNRGTIHYRLVHPHTIKREHILALELLLERVNRKEP